MRPIFYSRLFQDSLIKKAVLLMKMYQEELYEEALSELLFLSHKLGLKGYVFKQYICYLLATDENAFSLTAEVEGSQMDEVLISLAKNDIATIKKIFHADLFNIYLNEKDYEDTFVEIYQVLEMGAEEENIVDILIRFYHTYGTGIFNRYAAFKWNREEGLTGIKTCDPIRLEKLMGCDYQKKVLIHNTENFLKGKDANNALLFGDSGTGKSSMVKAILNEYYHQGLRLIELSKSDFKYFTKILSQIKDRGLKFILFLDDLSFEEFETEYKYMKALIEGGVEIKPQNVLIYATSNRRHLIRETWEERKGQDVHISDTRQEKLSLSDRFGLSLTFASPNQDLYLAIVNQLANDYQLNLPEHFLREKAIQWELLHGGRSGRTAKQFIQTLL